MIEGEERGSEFLKQVGARSIRELRKMPLEKLSPATLEQALSQVRIGPVIDQWVLTSPSVLATSQAPHPNIDILTGVTANLGTTVSSPVSACGSRFLELR